MPHSTQAKIGAGDTASLYAQTRDPRLLEQIAVEYGRLVAHVATKFHRPGVAAEDLVQTAWLALFRALERYDPAHGARFGSYVVPCMVGEIKRYFRDKARIVRAPRYLQTLWTRIEPAREQLLQTYGREPTPAELADHLQVAEEDLLAAVELGRSCEPRCLDERVGGEFGERSLRLSETLGFSDLQLTAVVEATALRQAMDRLDPRGRRVLELRFFTDRTQQEVAEELRVSQMQISRLERRALGCLREMMLSEDSSRTAEA